MATKTFYGVKIQGESSEIIRVIISGPDLNEAVNAFKVENNLDLFDTYTNARGFLKQQLNRIINRLNGIMFEFSIRREIDYDDCETSLKTIEYNYTSK